MIILNMMTILKNYDNFEGDDNDYSLRMQKIWSADEHLEGKGKGWKAAEESKGMFCSAFPVQCSV